MQWWTLQQLKSKDAQTRLKAVEKLAAQEDDSNVDALLSVLGDADMEVRRVAARALGRTKHEKCARPLSAALHDRAAEVREAAAEALKELGDSRAIDSLVSALKDANSAVRWRAANALESLGWRPNNDAQEALQIVALGKLEKASALGEAAIEPLMMVLKSDVYYKRMQAVEALSRISDPRVVKPLIGALQDSDNHVRVTAVEALANVGDARAVDPIILVLRDKDSRIRAAGIAALSKIGDARTIDPLARMIKDDSWDVRMAVVEALGKFKDPRVIDPLVKCLRDKDRDTRMAAVQALGKVADLNAIEPLVLSLADEYEPIRQAAIVALRRTDKNWERSAQALKAIPALQGLAASKDYWVRQAATELVTRLGGDNAVGPAQELGTFADPVQQKRLASLQALLNALKDVDRDLRQAAAEALGRIGDVRGCEPLTESLVDPDEWVRQAAAEALVALQWQPKDPARQALLMVILEHWDEAAALGAAAVDALSIALRHRNSDIRRRAAVTLGSTNSDLAIPHLLQALDDAQPTVRQAAAHGLETLRWQTPDLRVRARQLAELGRWEQIAQLGAVALDTLEEVARNKHQDRIFWSGAEIAIGLLTDPVAAPRLLELTQDPELAGAAAAGLTSIVRQHAANLSDEILQQVTALALVLQARYELDRQLGYVQSTLAEIDIQPVREVAGQELARRTNRTPQSFSRTILDSPQLA